MELTLEQVKAKSAARLSGLQPVIKDAATALIEFAYAHGVPIIITQGLRTIAEQDGLYAQGRTKPGQIVTNAKGGYSYHNFGVAIDFALLLPDGSVSWDTKRDGDGDGVADWSEVVADAKRIGWDWGGDWTSFKDLPHFQMDFGLSTADYRAGKRPTQAQLSTVVAQIGKLQGEEDEAMTAEEKKEFEELKVAVKERDGRIAALEARLNIDGKQTYAGNYKDAVEAAKAVGAIKTSADKSKLELNIIQMLYNMGLFKTIPKGITE
ncbi:Peptidoglycan L-alanyl-D-glutamate endopeptidase CwlK precursor [compost metagenome]